LPRQQSNPEREIRGFDNVLNENPELRLEPQDLNQSAPVPAIVNVVNVVIAIRRDAEDSSFNACRESTRARLQPQTLIVYGQDGQLLDPAYGVPARVYSPVKLGYKNTKYLTRILFLSHRNGGYWSDQGYEWYGGV
jgi:hypothetical protein